MLVVLRTSRASLSSFRGGAAPQEPYGKGVAQHHRLDSPHADLVAALTEGVLERLGGGDGPRGATDSELRSFVVAHIRVAPDGLDRPFGEAEGRGRGEN